MTTNNRFIVVATEPTPNPKAMKFVLNRHAIDSGSKSFDDATEAEGDPFAEKVYDFGVIEALYINDRFVSVKVASEEDWEWVLDPMIKCIESELVKYVGDQPEEKKATILDEINLEDFDDFDDEMKVEVIDAVMEESIRPYLANDGGGVIILGLEDDILSIQYQGACGGCSKSQSSTLGAIQSILNQKVSQKLKVKTVSVY